MDNKIFALIKSDKGKYLILKMNKETMFLDERYVVTGHVEKAESYPEAARREIKEETGLDNLRFVDGFAEKAAYEIISKRPPFKGERIEKHVTYFLCEAKDQDVIVDGREISDYRFLPLNKAEQAVKFRNLKIMLRKAYDFLSFKI